MDIDKLTGYILKGSADRLSAKLKKDRERANRLGGSVAEPKGPTIKQLDPYVTDTVGGKLARRAEANRAATQGREPIYGPSMKKGGMVKRTGFARLHKGEKVLTKHQAKRMHK